MTAQLDNSWEEHKLGDICEFKYGKGLPKRKRIPGKFPVYGAGGIVDYHEKPLVKGPGIIIGRKGSIGTVFFEKKDYYPIDTVFYVEKNERYNLKFLYALLKTLNLNKLNSDAAIPGLNRNTAYQQKMFLPNLDNQKKIASILSVYDDFIENNNNRIKILDKMTEILFKEWFINFRFPGHENVEMIGSEFGMIPDGWEIKKLSEICNQVIDGTHDTPKPLAEGYPLVTGKHITNGFIEFSKCYFISPEEHAKVIKRSKPEKYDTIFSNIGTLGSTVFVDQNFEFSIKNVALFKPLKQIYSRFIYVYFSLPQTLHKMESSASGTSQKFFSLKFLRNWKLLKPSDELISRFDELIKPITDQRSLLYSKNENLKKTRDLLLPKLISGKINVENLNINVVGMES